MDWLRIFLWISMGIVIYTYIGYGLLIYCLVLIKRFKFSRIPNKVSFYEPMVSFVIPCFNEADILENKIANCRLLDYPSDKLHIIFVTDGSTDHFKEVLKKYPDILLLHEDIRAGKTAAENRAMYFVKTPIVIFSDANTNVNSEAIRNMVKHFANQQIGCVSGEKRILKNKSDKASTAGEGMYWKYESILKKLDSAFNCSVGATGELVAFKSSLYTNLPSDTILDDFMQSMQIAAAGYKIIYEPAAFTTETASLTVKEELKRKIRIATGSWQSMQRLAGILKFRKTPLLFFQFISHKVLRWTVSPMLIVTIFLASINLSMEGSWFYDLLCYLQIFFYLAAFSGYLLENKKTRFTILFVPYYFCMMNYAAIIGFKNFLSTKQTGIWEKAVRKS